MQAVDARMDAGTSETDTKQRGELTDGRIHHPPHLGLAGAELVEREQVGRLWPLRVVPLQAGRAVRLAALDLRRNEGRGQVRQGTETCGRGAH